MTAALPASATHTEEPGLRVTDAMHWGLVTCAADAPLTAVAALMRDRRVHCVVVIDGSSRERGLWGVVSDLDLVAAASVRPLDEQTAAGTAMRPAVTIAPGEPLEEAMRRMTSNGVSHLVVVDPADTYPLGVLSTLDLAAVLAGDWDAAAEPDPYFPAPDSRL
ncbi:MAG: CBS domain-containing protein [Gaiellaceae bacterium]